MTEQTAEDQAVASNPLLSERFPIPFHAIRAEHVKPAVELLLKQMKQRIDDLGDPQTPRTYRDVLLALDSATEPLDFAMSVVRHLEGVATTPELRAVYNEVQEPVSMFYTSIPLHAQLWAAVKAVAESTEAGELPPIHKRYLKKTVSGFRRAGADLDAEGKKRLGEIDVALTKATTKFAENVLDATNAFELVLTDERQLAGLPESARMMARESARLKNRQGWRLTLQAPSYAAAMTYLDDRSLRQELWEASNSRATSGDLDNRGLTAEILRLRRDK